MNPDEIKLNDNRQILRDYLKSQGCGHWEIKQFGRSYAAFNPDAKRVLRLKGVKI